MVEDKGCFSMRKAYKLLQGDFHKKPRKNLICSSICPPKEKFITWLTLWGKLRTKEALARWNLGIDTTCALCGNHLENLHHLFFDCCVSREIWTKILQWLKITRSIRPWDDEVKLITQKSKGKSPTAVTLKLCFVISIYHIWIETNARVFRIQASTPDIVIRTIMYQALLRVQGEKNLLDSLRV